MRALLLGLSLSFACSASAQQTVTVRVDPPPQVTVDAAHQATAEQIREYFKLIGFEQTMKNMMSQMIGVMKTTSVPYLPESFWVDMQSSLSNFDFVSNSIPIYQKYLSRDDLAGILAFYHSEAGQHILSSQGPITQDAQLAFRTAGRVIGEQVGARHSEEIEAARQKYEQGIATKQSPTINMNPDPK